MTELPATELAVRTWLRTRSAVVSLLSNDTRRIDVDAPKEGRDYVALYRAGGAPDRYVPLDTAAITFHCYGGTRKKALDLQTAIVGALHSMSSETLSEGVFGRDAEVLSAFWLPDGDHARYVVTALVTASRSALAQS